MLAPPALLAQDKGTILYQEPLRLLSADTSRSGVERLVFDALGRRFELVLTPNARMQRRRVRLDYDLLRGRVDGQPGSWARLTRRGDRLAGMFFDGDEHYAIEPWEDIQAQSATGGDNDGETNAVYRLRDVLLPVGAASCGPALPAKVVRGDVAFAQLGDELGNLPKLEAQGATRRIELRAVADYEFFQTWGITSEAEILSRMNIVDGIFSSQLGLEIDVAAVEVFQTAADPFTTDVPGDLLDEVVDYRVSRATGEGLTHLFTWRDLQGTTRGIAYLGSACMTTFAAALSQQVGSNLTFGALIAAHEIGHNLNAQHDGEVSSDPGFPNPCDTVPETFLMAPTITGSDQFSQCSIDTMTNYLNTLSTSCVSGIGPYLDGVPATLPAVVDAPATLNFRVINSEGTATGVELSLTYPASLDVQPQGIACTLSQGSALCDLGDLADSEQVPLSFEIQSPTTGNFAIIVALATDFTPDADRATINVNVKATAAVQGGGGGGGGGALGPCTLALLFGGCLALRRRATRS
ncbi:MAG: hypothetical protein JSV45_02520 [Chromatiales bacterium]|nr:MAG: hypothetical protein JSV45_02520 [Chromatiales bacterium]